MSEDPAAWGPAGWDPEGPPKRLSGQTRRPEFLDDPGYADGRILPSDRGYQRAETGDDPRYEQHRAPIAFRKRSHMASTVCA